MHAQPMTARRWAPTKRLHPWVVYDLERLAWVIEDRLPEMTPAERAMIQAAVDRLTAALNDA